MAKHEKKHHQFKTPRTHTHQHTSRIDDRCDQTLKFRVCVRPFQCDMVFLPSPSLPVVCDSHDLNHTILRESASSDFNYSQSSSGPAPTGRTHIPDEAANDWRQPCCRQAENGEQVVGTSHTGGERTGVHIAGSQMSGTVYYSDDGCAFGNITSTVASRPNRP